jgi:hypothetical protein
MSAQPVQPVPTPFPVQRPTVVPLASQAERELRIMADRERLAQLNDLAAKIKAEQEEIKARLRVELGAGKHEQFRVTVSPTMRFNAEQARLVLGKLEHGEELIASISETVISSELAKRVLAPAVYELCQVEHGKATVRL